LRDTSDESSGEEGNRIGEYVERIPLLNSVGTRMVAAELSYEGGYPHVRVEGGSVRLGGWL